MRYALNFKLQYLMFSFRLEIDFFPPRYQSLSVTKGFTEKYLTSVFAFNSYEVNISVPAEKLVM